MDQRLFKSDSNHSSIQHYVAKKTTCLLRVSGTCEQNIADLHTGMLVKANDTLEINALKIRVKESKDPQLWSETEWRVCSLDLIPVSHLIWQLLAAIPLQKRVQIASNTQLCKDLQNIHVNSRINYLHDPELNVVCLATVKFIGPLPEIGEGFYYILEILEKSEFFPPHYFSSAQVKGVCATISNICPIKDTSDNNRSMKKSNTFSHSEILLPKILKDASVNIGNSYSDDCKKTLSKQDFNLSLLEKNTWFNDSKNNNGEGSSITKDLHSSNLTKSNLQSEARRSEARNTPKAYNFSYPGGLLEKDESNKARSGQNASELNIGSNVQVLLGKDTRSGIIRWIGTPEGMAPGKLMAAVELDDGHPLGSDGIYNDIRYIDCRPHRAFFTDLKQCHQYDIPMNNRTLQINTNNFEDLESAVISGTVRPICVEGNLENICGKFRGIQGHHNSCYLDATLFSMFTFTSVFDNLLYRPPNEKDCPQYEEVQRVLREEIVNPLRKNVFVRADRVMKLRTLLEKLSSISGLTSEEKDPEEFLTSLVAQILNAEPFLKLSSGQEAYHYQLFVEKDDELNLPTVQQLLEQSFLTSNIRLKEVPSCLIIQMPRFGKSFKMYQKIQPTLLLDVTDIIEDSPRQCTVCGKLAQYECKKCYGQCGVGLESIAFCLECLEKAHRHEKRTNHEPKELIVPVEFAALQEHCPVFPRLYLELSAVVCIETSHYVSFVKCGSGSEAPWCFFDSMADRKGEQNGYNIPEMVPCPDFPYWLSEEGARYLTDLTDDRQLPEHAKRLLCDAYMCMYQSPDVMMYNRKTCPDAEEDEKTFDIY